LLVASDPSRRRFLTVLAAGAFASALDAGCSSPSGGVGPAHIGTVDAGNVSEYPVGSLGAVDAQPVAVGRDAQGVYAMTLTCTHAGCNMAVDGSVSFSAGLACACHGSRFDRNGNVTQGPATKPLVHFKVTIDASGEITVHGDQQVSESTRTAVA
jgi:cytochrome b6-f complex iron-sulfur subunit